MFIDSVKEKFSFLEKVFGLAIEKKSDNSVEYSNKEIAVLIGWHKGEVEIDLYVQIESDVFKPYLSRMFRLTEIIQHIDSKALKNAPQFPNYITTDEDCHIELAWGAKMMKTYCDPILRGDLKILEEITKKRSGK